MMSLVFIVLYHGPAIAGSTSDGNLQSEKLSPTEEIKQWEALASDGDANAQHTLGVYYYEGVKLKKDYAMAVKLFSAAAKKGHAEAMYSLGVMYYTGNGIKQDYSLAKKWWYKAASNGHIESMLNIAALYSNGTGVEKDDSKAFKWDILAAKNNSAEGQYRVGLMYEGGEGISRNHEESIIWLNKSADNGYEKAKKKLNEINKNPEVNIDKTKLTATVEPDNEPWYVVVVRYNDCVKIEEAFGGSRTPEDVVNYYKKYIRYTLKYNEPGPESGIAGLKNEDDPNSNIALAHGSGLCYYTLSILRKIY